MNQVKHLLTKKVLSTILETKDEVFKELDIESFYVSSFIREDFEKTIDIRVNYLFQFTYRNFYGLDNIGLTKEFKKRYFELMQEYRSKPINLEAIYIDLYEYGRTEDLNSTHFSLVSKLVNTINNSYPIYDSEIIRIFNFKQPYYLEDKNERMTKYLEQYDYIKFVSDELVENENIREILLQMDSLYGKICKSQFNTKKLELLIWGTGKYFKNLIS